MDQEQEPNGAQSPAEPAAEHASGSPVEAAKEKFEEVKEKLGPKLEEAKEKLGPKLEEAKEKAGPTVEKAKGMIGQLLDKLRKKPPA